MITTWNYEELFDSIDYYSIILPSLVASVAYDDLLNALIDELNRISCLGFTSFLNMVSQTQSNKKVIQLTNNDLINLGLIDRPHERILYTRSNLLHLFSKLILKQNDGSTNVTGLNNNFGTRKFYGALAFINSEINKHGQSDRPTQALFSIFIRDFPFLNNPEMVYSYYSRWITRYETIYTDIISNNENNYSNLGEGIKKIEEISGISLKEQLIVSGKLLNWFLKGGFKPDNINSFYINPDNFPTDNALLNLVKDYSINYSEMRSYLRESIQEDNDKERRFSPFYSHLTAFFLKPIIELRTDCYAIIDFKFLIEGTCSGLLWKINKLQNSFLRCKEEYGKCVENYFIARLNETFNLSDISKDNNPDAVIIIDNYILLLEFTTEYYKFSSLFGQDLSDCYIDLDKLLFNKKNSPRKKDAGKFIKLNTYVKNFQNHYKNHIIIPILVTEKYIGDYDLLNFNDDYLKKKILQLELTHLYSTKPTIICLDHIEEYCLRSKNDKLFNARRFKDILIEWDELEKSQYQYCLSFFINKMESHQSSDGEIT